MSPINFSKLGMEQRLLNVEIKVAQHDVKLNLIAWIAAATFTAAFSTFLLIMFR